MIRLQRDFVSMKSQSHPDRTYFYDVDKVFPAIRAPQPISQQVSYKPKGASKTLQARDDSYVELTALRPKVRGNRFQRLSVTEANQLKKKQLTALKEAIGHTTAQGVLTLEGTSIAPGLQGVYVKDLERIRTVSRNKSKTRNSQVLAANGGLDASHIRQYHRIDHTPILIPLGAYHQLCSDIKKAHEHQIYFRDLKNRNLLFRQYLETNDGRIKRLHEPKVMLIDIDDVITPTIGINRTKTLGTNAYRTEQLKLHIESDTTSEYQRNAHRKQADNYALLVNILKGSTHEMSDISLSREDEYGKVYPVKNGVIDHIQNGHNPQREMRKIDAAIQQVVRDDKIKDVKKFLSSPTRHPLREEIFDIIDWSKTPNADFKPRGILKHTNK